MITSTSILVAPSLEASALPSQISLDMAKLGHHIDDEEDLFLNQCIQAAIGLIAKSTGFVALPTTFVTTFDCLPAIATLPRWPVASISSVKYYNADNELVTLTNGTDYFTLMPTDQKSEIYRAAELDITLHERPDAIEVTYVAGASPLSPIAVQAISLAVGDWFENRENQPENKLTTSIELGFTRLCRHLRPGRYAR